MTDLNSENSSAPPSERKGCLVASGIVLGAILTPIAVYLLMEIINASDPDCSAGGEGRIGCAMRLLSFTTLSILPGAVVGFLVAYALSVRRNSRRG